MATLDPVALVILLSPDSLLVFRVFYARVRPGFNIYVSCYYVNVVVSCLGRIYIYIARHMT